MQELWSNAQYQSLETLRERSKSRGDEITWEQEQSIKRALCRFVSDVGQELDLLQWTVATAQYYIHRFYAVRSLARNDRFVVAIAAIFLSAKAEESAKSLRECIAKAAQVRFKDKAEQDRLTKDRPQCDLLRENVLFAERALLYIIGFDFNIEHPHHRLMPILAKFGKDPADKRLAVSESMSAKEREENEGEVHRRNYLAQLAWNFATESMCTPLCLQFPPAKIAFACVDVAARFAIKNGLQRDSKWVAVMEETCGADREEITQIEGQLLESFRVDSEK
ncbi:unnamed protein product [Pedinophyceae sp. YPF-701]|nr:unnamed protein product [Pedinophyceae sp. YPF-701]